jgi:hypothetical protein
VGRGGSLGGIVGWCGFGARAHPGRAWSTVHWAVRDEEGKRLGPSSEGTARGMPTTERKEVIKVTRFVREVGKIFVDFYAKRFGALTCRTPVPVMEGMRG